MPSRWIPDPIPIVKIAKSDTVPYTNFVKIDTLGTSPYPKICIVNPPPPREALMLSLFPSFLFHRIVSNVANCKIKLKTKKNHIGNPPGGGGVLDQILDGDVPSRFQKHTRSLYQFFQNVYPTLYQFFKNIYPTLYQFSENGYRIQYQL